MERIQNPITPCIANGLWAIVWHFCQMTAAGGRGEPKVFLCEWAVESRINQGMTPSQVTASITSLTR